MSDDLLGSFHDDIDASDYERPRRVAAVFRLELPLAPSDNHATRVGVARGRDGKLRGFRYRTDTTKAWCNYAELKIKAAVAAKKWKPLEGPVVMAFDWYFPNLKSDVGNRRKYLQDACQRHVFRNDNQITLAIERKHIVQGAGWVLVEVRADHQATDAVTTAIAAASYRAARKAAA